MKNITMVRLFNTIGGFALLTKYGNQEWSVALVAGLAIVTYNFIGLIYSSTE